MHPILEIPVFWLAAEMVIGLVLLTIATARELWGLMLAVLIVWGITASVAGLADITGFLTLHWAWILPACIAYLIAGVPYMVIRWRLFVRNRANEAKEERMEFLREHGYAPDVEMDTPIPDRLLAEWRKDYRRPTKYPEPRHHKSELLFWMSWWPLCMTWTLVDEPIAHFFKWVYRRLESRLNKIAKDAYKDVQ